MKKSRWFLTPILAIAATLYTSIPGQAAQLRYHYVPVDAAGNTRLAPVVQSGGGGSPGERVRFLGLIREPATTQPRPTHLVTFRHSFTGHNITVPLTLRPDTPRMAVNRESVTYNYGSETVEVQFLKDGSVDVVYSSGLLRRI
jgi:hypothetical protein